ncbi:MAG: amidohydrolase family protein [Actinomycetota bacterium]|nr:amidohydrolase family protein [Actinomycetota bacterium]
MRSANEQRPLVARGRVLPIDDPPLRDGLVLVTGGRLAYVGPVNRAPSPGHDAEEVDVGDGTVLPGLIDAHVHLTCDGGPRFIEEVHGVPPEDLALKAATNAARSLACGIVAVRDLGAPGSAAIAVGHAVKTRGLIGCEVAAAGRALTAPGGHIPFLGVEVAGPEHMGAVARQQLEAGAAGIKLVATGGILTEGVALGDVAYDEEELAAASRVAREAGAWVAAHVIGVEGTKRALRAGATTIEHGVFLDHEAIELMRSSGAVLVPTIIPLAKIIEHGRAGGIPEDAVAKAESIVDNHVDSFQRAARAGVPIAAGTDAGTPFNPHGNLAEEARLLVERAGLSHEQALRATTRVAGRCLGRDDLGHLSEGVPGHLVVVEGDPSDDIAALTRVRSVVHGGRTTTPSIILRAL